MADRIMVRVRRELSLEEAKLLELALSFVRIYHSVEGDIEDGEVTITNRFEHLREEFREVEVRISESVCPYEQDDDDDPIETVLEEDPGYRVVLS
jgi:hypothetical protein